MNLQVYPVCVCVCVCVYVCVCMCVFTYIDAQTHSQYVTIKFKILEHEKKLPSKQASTVSFEVAHFSIHPVIL